VVAAHDGVHVISSCNEGLIKQASIAKVQNLTDYLVIVDSVWLVFCL
jgi:hypothetical protein